MLKLFSILCLVGASMCLGNPEEMLDKYYYMTVISKCFGEETIINWKQRINAAAETCSNPAPVIMEPKERPIPMPMRPTFEARYYNPLGPMPSPNVGGVRWTRSMGSVDMSPEAIEEMKNELVNDLNNVTCVLKEMKYMTYDNQIDYNSIAQEIMSLPVNDLLKGDLLAATQQCKDFATCLPFDKYNNPIDHEFGATIAFIDCIHTRKAMACMKDDMRKYAHLMGFEGDQDTEEGKAKMDEIASLFTHGLH